MFNSEKVWQSFSVSQLKQTVKLIKVRPKLTILGSKY